MQELHAFKVSFISGRRGAALEAVIAHERVLKGSSDGVVVMEGKG